MKMQINNINDLIILIEQSKFSKIQLIEIVEKSLNVFINPESSNNLVCDIKIYWSKYGNLPLNERPLFLDETKVDFDNLMKSPTAKKINDNLETYY